MTGNSLRFLSGDISAALKRTQGSFPVHLSDAAGNFVYLTRTAGQQYDDIRAYLESRDKVYIADWVAEIEESLKTPAHSSAEYQKVAAERLNPAGLPPQKNLAGSIIFSVRLVISGTACPLPLRATLKVIGTLGIYLAAIVGLAYLIVAFAPVELTVAGVAFAIGVALMIRSFLKSIYARSVESYETKSGGPLRVFLISIGDTIGITAVVEAKTNKSALSGTPLNLDEEGRWGKGIGGGFQFLLTVLGVRSAFKGKAPVTDVVPVEPTPAPAAPAAPAPAVPAPVAAAEPAPPPVSAAEVPAPAALKALRARARELRKAAIKDPAAVDALYALYESQPVSMLRKMKGDPVADAVYEKIRATNPELAKATESRRQPHQATVRVTEGGRPVGQPVKLVSGGVTPEQAAALGDWEASLGSHTEAKAVSQIPLKAGQTMRITGQYDPCGSCRARMQAAANATGGTILYWWDGGPPEGISFTPEAPKTPVPEPPKTPANK